MSLEEEDDDFDMFAPSAGNPTLASKASSTTTTTQQVVKHALDHADSEGYFRAVPGTALKGPQSTYVVCGELGKGVFSTVYLVKTTTRDDSQVLVACKVLRANETMYKAGLKELRILKEIASSAQHAHVVKLLDSFELESHHLVLIFERMGMNLRETLNKFGQNCGLSLDAVRNFARQLFSALALLRDLSVVHADLKPDNILVSEDLRRCALSDFGSAFHLQDAEALIPTPYLCSRFYRAPEIILGLPYGCESDVWSLGVTLYELFTGEILFPGETNNDMLNLIQTRIGRVPNALVKKHIAVYEQKLELEPHFQESDLKFKRHEKDPASGQVVRRLVKIPDHPAPSQSLRALVITKGLDAEDEEQLLMFAQLLEQCLTIDAHQRMDPRKFDVNKFLMASPTPAPSVASGSPPSSTTQQQTGDRKRIKQ